MNELTIKRLQTLCTVLFIGLCLLHYFSQRPLWLDEKLILENIASNSYASLFAPLKNSQAFPRVYLSAVKFIAEFFNDHVLSLRFLSLIFMLAAYVCWMKIYRQYIKNSKVFLLTLFSFVCAYRLSYYGAELKPYSMDVFVIVLCVLFLNYQKMFMDDSATKVLWLGGILFPITVFFSYAAIFIVWIVSVNFILLTWRNHKLQRLTLAHIICLIICLGIFYQVDFKYSFGDQGLHRYWQSYFIQTDSLLNFLDSFFEGIKRMVTYWCGTEKWQYRMAVPFIPFFLYALFRYGMKYFREDGLKIFRVETLMLVFFVELFLLGIFKLYPFTGERITLFLAPFVFYLILKGIDDLGGVIILGKAGKQLRAVFLSYYCVYCGICLVNTVKVYLMLY